MFKRFVLIVLAASKKERSRNLLRSINPNSLGLVVVVIVVMIVFVPVAVRPPATSIFIPPSMAVLPAPLASLSQFTPPAIRFRTVPAVVLGSLVKIVVRLDDAFLAVVVREGTRRAAEQDETGKRRCR
jgi:hypothetical protein